MTTRWISALSLLFSLAGCSGEAPYEAIGSTSAPFEAMDVKPGRGFDQLADEVRAACTEGFDGSAPTASGLPNTGGQVTELVFQQVDSLKAVRESLRISPSAAVRGLLGGGDAKLTFLEDAEVSDDSVYLLASARVVNSARRTDPVRLSPSAAALLGAGDAAGFRARCGDGFISGYRGAGELHGLFRIVARSAEDKRTLQAALIGSKTPIKKDWNYARTFEELAKGREASAQTVQITGLGTERNGCADIACFARRAQELPALVAEHPRIVDVTVTPYTTLELPPGAETPLDTRSAREVEDALVTERVAQLELRKRLEGPARRPGLYVPFDASDVARRIAQLTDNLATLRAAAARCVQDHRTCAVPPLTPVDPRVPALRTPCTPGAQRTTGSALFRCTETCDADGLWVRGACWSDSKIPHRVIGL